jgi:hypothetical protein
MGTQQYLQSSVLGILQHRLQLRRKDNALLGFLDVLIIIKVLK